MKYRRQNKKLIWNIVGFVSVLQNDKMLSSLNSIVLIVFFCVEA